MSDPYGVLGVSPSASDDDVKKAYRDLARKYHPDNYVDNPLADLAQEKMKEINEAYDQITRERAGGSKSGTYQSGGYSGGSAQYRDVRSAINARNFAYAENLLRQMPQRDAEWNFLMGSVCAGKGWLDEARGYFQRAVSMDPSNPEYKQALAYVSNASPYRQSAGYAAGPDMCDICTGLMCMNMLCRC